MRQTIRSITGMEFVCEIPEGWDAALIHDRAGDLNPAVVMVPRDGSQPPHIVLKEEDGVWRQHEVRL